MKKLLVLIPILWVLFLASCTSWQDQKVQEDTNSKVANVTNIEDQKTEDKQIKDISLDQSKWQYITYSKEAIQNTEWKKVLFFNASWCGSCKTADKNITESWVPSGLSVFKVDYDSNFELRKKYWIVAQHTFVQVDNEWNMIKKWIWGKTIEDIEWEVWFSEKTSVTFEKGIYKDVTESNVAEEVKAGKWRRVLFFHASWCATCKAADTSLRGSEIPAGLSIFKIDFDSNVELRQKYGVTSQHTFVEVDKKMNKLKMWRASKTVEDILSGLGEHKNIKVKTETKTEVKEEIQEETKTEVKEEVEVEVQPVLETEEVKNNIWQYVEYSQEAVKNALWDKILFFHATWCSSCKAADKNISAETIPAWLNIFKVDFDSSTALRKQYEVVWQHTFVQIDDNGNMIKKWFGSRSVKDILAEVKS